METYKIYAAMLALAEFTVADLIQYTAAKKSTIYSVISRSSQYLEELGSEESGRPGGQYERYRVRADQVEALSAKLKGITQIADILPERKIDVPADLKVAEDALINLYPVARSRAERQELIEIAKMHLVGGRMEFEAALSGQALPARNSIAFRVVQTHINFIQRLTKYSEEMFALEPEDNNEQLTKLQAARDELIGFFQTQLSILEGEQKQSVPTFEKEGPRAQPPAWTPVSVYAPSRSDSVSGRVFAVQTGELAPPAPQTGAYVFMADGGEGAVPNISGAEGVVEDVRHIILFDGVESQPDPLTYQVESFLQPFANREGYLSIETVPLTHGRLPGAHVTPCAHDLCLLTVDSRATEATEAFKSVLDVHGNASHLIVLDAGYNPQLRNEVFSKHACYVGDGLSLNRDALWGTITQKLWKF